MKQDLLASLRAAVVALLGFTVLTGLVYPGLVLGIGQLVFARQANGSLITDRGEVSGSALVGQAFTHPGYLWGRPSATGPVAYNARASSGANEGFGGNAPGELNPDLRAAVVARAAALRAADPDNDAPIPSDLVTASASGLDPHVSPAGARYQAARIARARQLSLDRVIAIIDAHTAAPTLGFLGEPRVNVLAVNRALDRATGGPPPER